MTTLYSILLVAALGLVLGGFNCYVLRRLYWLHERCERLEAALLWSMTRHCHGTQKPYRIHRVVEMLGINTAYAENLITKHLRNSVNNEGN